MSSPGVSLLIECLTEVREAEKQRPINIWKEKRCTVCQLPKPHSHFGPDTTCAGGYKTVCKTCIKRQGSQIYVGYKDMPWVDKRRRQELGPNVDKPFF